MIDPKIAALRFEPKRGSPWASLRVGMTLTEAVTALGSGPRNYGYITDRVRLGRIVLDRPLPQRTVIASDISDADTGRGAEEPPRQTVTRPCLRCRQPFQRRPRQPPVRRVPGPEC